MQVIQTIRDIFQKGTDTTPTYCQTPTSYQGNGRNVLHPIVYDNRPPEDILRSMMTPDEYDAIAEFLEMYQKKRPEWDAYRSKLPQVLVKKLKQMLDECKMDGFVHPVSKDGKIYFSQILTRSQNIDKCTLCTNSIYDSTCKGQLIIRNNNKCFVKCYEKI